MSYRYEVRTGTSWAGNATVFATHEEADLAGRELLSRWWVPEEHRVVETTDKVNWYWDKEIGRPKPLPQPMEVDAEAYQLMCSL